MTNSRTTDGDFNPFRDSRVTWFALGVTSLTDKGLAKLAGFPGAGHVECQCLNSPAVIDVGHSLLPRFPSLRVRELRDARVTDD